MGPHAVIAVFDSVEAARRALRGLARAAVLGVELSGIDDKAPGEVCVVTIDVAAAADTEHVAQLMRENGARQIEKALPRGAAPRKAR